MAIYHCSVKVISRSSGRSSVGASAYRSGSKLYDERSGLNHDYTKKTGVEYQEIMIPNNVLKWANDREKLWNAVEKIEKSKNSQLAREVEVSLPNELSKQARVDLVKDYVKENFVDKGMVADFAIHDKGEGNPHAHIMLTMRPFEKDGTWGAKGKKEYILDKDGNKIYTKKGNAKSRKISTTNWDRKETLESWRKDWSKKANKYLEKEGYKEKIDHRSYKVRGIKKVPTKHEGHIVKAMESRGVETEIGNLNRQIQDKNKMIELIDKQIKHYERSLEHERTGTNGNKNRDTGTERGTSEYVTDLFFKEHGESPQVDSSRTGDTCNTNKQEYGGEQDRQTDTNQETRGKRESKSRIDNQLKQGIQGCKTRNDRPQINESTRDTKDLPSYAKGNTQDRGKSQGNDKSDKGHGIPSKEDTNSELEGKNQAIHNTTLNNNRVDVGANRSIPTSEPFDEILKSLSSAIQKVDNIEKFNAEQQQKILQKQKNKKNEHKTKNKKRSMGWER